MMEILGIPVSYAGSNIGEAAINDAGKMLIRITDQEFYDKFFVLFTLGEVSSFSIHPNVTPARPAIEEKVENETHDDGTLNKVYAALADCELSYHKIIEAINSMQNAGILFRERMK